MRQTYLRFHIMNVLQALTYYPSHWFRIFSIQLILWRHNRFNNRGNGFTTMKLVSQFNTLILPLVEKSHPSFQIIAKCARFPINALKLQYVGTILRTKRAPDSHHMICIMIYELVTWGFFPRKQQDVITHPCPRRSNYIPQKTTGVVTYACPNISYTMLVK